uniref:Kappa-carrageenase n=1 Tax=Pseudomonas phage Arace01 TaxID=3138526 RepID=A0AAU6VZQ6_9VIRU
MAQYQITWKASTREVLVQLTSKAAAAGFVKIGEFEHNDTIDPLEFKVNHVVWHHVRDALYFQRQLDMQVVSIKLDPAIAGDFNPVADQE